MIYYNRESRDKLKAGVDALANAVKVTLGPGGKNVVIKTEAGPHITKDGVTVAKYVFLEDIIEDMGAEMLRQVSLGTNKEVGDGTTTATVLAQAILREGFDEINNGKDPNEIKKSIDADLKVILDRLDSMVTKIEIEDTKRVAMISTNGDEELSDIIYECYKEVDGNIMFDVSETAKTHYKITKGLSFENASYLSTYFINTEDSSVKYDDVNVFLYNGKFDSVKEVYPVLTQTDRPVVIFCDDMDKNAIMTLVKNSKEGTVQSVAVRSPGFGYGRLSALKDISAYTGAKIYQKGNKLEKIQFGKAKQILVEKYKTIIKEGEGNASDIEARIKDLEFSKTEELDKTHQRILQFQKGLATIYVGAGSEIEMKEKRDRLEDGINAVRAAAKEGVIPGGGYALFSIGEGKNDTVLYRAIKEPRYQLLWNQGETVENLKTLRTIDKDVIDPVLVTKTALKNACSVASTILTTNAAIGYE